MDKVYDLCGTFKWNIHSWFNELLEGPEYADILIHLYDLEASSKQAERWLNNIEEWISQESLPEALALGYIIRGGVHNSKDEHDHELCLMFDPERIETWANFRQLFREKFVRDKTIWEGTENYPYTLNFDGAARKNPNGRVGIGGVLRSPLETHSYNIVSEYLGVGVMTNNEAEYEALFRGLTVAYNRGVRHILARGDSELIVKQVRGEYRVNDPKLQVCLSRVDDTVKLFKSFHIVHIRRALNKQADRLANDAISRACQSMSRLNMTQ